MEFIGGNANDNFGSPMGTDGYHKVSFFTKIVATDGVLSLIQACGAFWLTDLICSHQTDPKVSQEEFQVWDLYVHENSATAVCGDGNDNTIVMQDIPFTDFPYDKATIWLTGGVMLLPNEY